MVIDMNDAKLKTLAQLRAFLDGSAGVDFRPAGDDLARYALSHASARSTRRSSSPVR